MRALASIILLVALIAGCSGTGTMSGGTGQAVASLAPSVGGPSGSSIATEPSLGTDELILTEASPRGPNGICTTQGVFEVRLELTEISGSTALIGELVDPSDFPEFDDGFPPIFWPYGFSAELGPPAVVLDDMGDVVATEDEVVRLAGGSIDDRGYHACLINGVEYLD